MRYFRKYLLKIGITLAAILSFSAWAYYFSGLPAKIGLIDVPQVRLERCTRLDGSSIRILLSSEKVLEDFNGTSYLRILGSKESTMDTYSGCFIGNELKKNILLESSTFSFSYMNKGRYFYEVSLFSPECYDGIYLRVFYVKAFGYIYGSNLVSLSSEL